MCPPRFDPPPAPDPESERRFRMTMELAEFAERLKRGQLRRDNPSLADAEIDDLVRAWYLDKPRDFTGRPIRIRKPGEARGAHRPRASKRMG